MILTCSMFFSFFAFRALKLQDNIENPDVIRACLSPVFVDARWSSDRSHVINVKKTCVHSSLTTTRCRKSSIQEEKSKGKFQVDLNFISRPN